MPTVPDPDEIFTPRFIKKYSDPDMELLIEILDGVERILKKESKLVEIPQGRLYFVGDTHGNFPVTLHAIKHLFPPKGSGHSAFDRVIILGDFIDRGLYAVENVNFLMAIKYFFPDKLILLRGNHETREINIRFDFYERVLRRYSPSIFEKYNRIFARLPLAAITWNHIFAVHGGIPENLDKLGDINGLDDEVNPEDRITFQILWNDPVEKDGWFFRNFRGKYSRKFGRDAFDYFIKKHGIRLMLRAHEPRRKGYRHYFGARLISLDSTGRGRKKKGIKVFIVEKDGSYRIAEVENFEYDISRFFK